MVAMSVLLSLRDKILEVNIVTENKTTEITEKNEITEKDRLRRELDKKHNETQIE